LHKSEIISALSCDEIKISLILFLYILLLLREVYTMGCLQDFLEF